MNLVTLTDFIRPIGSVYFSSLEWNFNPADLFGGQWTNSGIIKISKNSFYVWHRTG